MLLRDLLAESDLKGFEIIISYADHPSIDDEDEEMTYENAKSSMHTLAKGAKIKRIAFGEFKITAPGSSDDQVKAFKEAFKDAEHAESDSPHHWAVKPSPLKSQPAAAKKPPAEKKPTEKKSPAKRSSYMSYKTEPAEEAQYEILSWIDFSYRYPELPSDDMKKGQVLTAKQLRRGTPAAAFFSKAENKDDLETMKVGDTKKFKKYTDADGFMDLISVKRVK